MNERKFDETAYLNAYPDIAEAVSNGAFKSGWEHYKKYGRREGREASGLTERERKVFHNLKRSGVGLEIGPSINPLAPKRKGFNVEIIDHASAEELRQKYSGQNVNVNNIEEVDCIWEGEPLSKLLGKTEHYDWIIASHVVEHIPNPILFLQECTKILKPMGVLSLVIPDKRFCFDYFSPLTTTGNWIDANVEKRTRPTPGQIYDHFANACTVNGSISWSEKEYFQNKAILHGFDRAKAQLQSALSVDSNYTDVHCWRFTPLSFQLIISDLNSAGIMGFKILSSFDTVGCEFYTSLGKCEYYSSSFDRRKQLEKIDEEFKFKKNTSLHSFFSQKK
jgi:predicted SAM-dependent methyltransferase